MLAKALESRKIYKCFSNVNIDSILPSLFDGVKESYTHLWEYTFPQMRPNSDFQPLRLNGVFYLSTMESVAVAMEGSVISGKNVATLIAEEEKMK